MVSSRIILFVALGMCAMPAAAQAPVPAPAQVPPPAPGTAAPADNSPLAQILQNTQNRFECPSADYCRLTGQVDIEISAGTRFFADEIDLFTKPTFRVVASGNVVFSGPEGRIAAERVEYNVTDGTGTFHQASGIMSLGATVDRVQFGNQDPDVYFYGDTIEKIGAQSYRLTRGGFTTCVQPTPRWEVTSGSVVINLDDYAIARNMILRVKGVPMMYLPILYYPIKDEDRATGFLLPTYGTSTFRGQAVSNAFFWAIGRSHDATFFHDWFTRTGQGAGAEYRYVAGQGSYGNFRVYHLDQHQAEFTQSGSTTILPAQSSYEIRGSGNQLIGTALRLHQRIDYTSSIITKQLYQQDLYQASNATRTIEAGLTGTWGALTTGALFQRTETFTNANSSQLYGSTPRLTAAVAPQRLFGLPVYGSVNNEFAYLPYRTIVDGRVISPDKTLARLDVLPTARAALSRLSYLTFNTSASYRTTYYTRSADERGNVTTDPLTRQYLTLRSDVTGPVLAKIWDTPESGYSERMKHLIEPTFALEYIPAINNARRVLTLSDTSDIVPGDSTRLTYGINNRFLYRARTADGSAGTTIQFLTVGVQQTYYVTERASVNDQQYLSNAFRLRSVDLSDIALNIKVTPGPRLDSTTRFEYDVHGEGLHVFTTAGTAQFGASSTTINYSHRRRPTANPESSMTWSSSLNLLEGRTRGAYALTWDIGRAGILNQSVGLTYMAQCCGIQAEFQKFKFTPGAPIGADRRFNVSFVLAGLGTFSNFFGAFGGLTGSGY